MRLFLILASISLKLFSPSVPQTGTSKIVFSSNREGSYQIYVMNGDGSGVVRLTNSNANDDLPIGKLRWSWGGTIRFQWFESLNSGRFILNPSTTGFTQGQATNEQMVTMNGNVKPSVIRQCPGGPPLTNYKIDSARSFVRRHYNDFLGRGPEGDPGWDFWTSEISQCGFDSECIHAQRINIGLAFFFSSEFIDTDPDMQNPPGSPAFDSAVYNRKFVYWCYMKYLHRDPHNTQEDLNGWGFWTHDLDSNGDYAHTIDAFQLSTDYRNMFGNAP